MQLPEPPPEREVLCVIDGLIAEEDDAVHQKGSPDLGVRPVVERFTKVDAGDFRADSRV